MKEWIHRVDTTDHDHEIEIRAPLLVCVLGGFRLLRAGEPVQVSAKASALLCLLARSNRRGVPRDTILAELWPEGDQPLASRSLNTLIWSLHRRLGAALGGAQPVTHTNDLYQLNADSGVLSDVACFEMLADAGDAQFLQNPENAARLYSRAVALYRGDLHVSADMNTELVIYREQLRSRFQTLLAYLARFHYEGDDLGGCLQKAQQLLLTDPCHEEMHRLIMLCYAKRGERSLALHQYRLCVSILREEFDTAPEPATTELFQRIRNDPGRVDLPLTGT
jgi:DNA-binding SARP family transcriptional activator